MPKTHGKQGPKAQKGQKLAGHPVGLVVCFLLCGVDVRLGLLVYKESGSHVHVCSCPRFSQLSRDQDTYRQKARRHLCACSDPPFTLVTTASSPRGWAVFGSSHVQTRWFSEHLHVHAPLCPSVGLFTAETWVNKLTTDDWSVCVREIVCYAHPVAVSTMCTTQLGIITFRLWPLIEIWNYLLFNPLSQTKCRQIDWPRSQVRGDMDGSNWRRCWRRAFPPPWRVEEDPTKVTGPRLRNEGSWWMVRLLAVPGKSRRAKSADPRSGRTGTTWKNQTRSVIDLESLWKADVFKCGCLAWPATKRQSSRRQMSASTWRMQPLLQSFSPARGFQLS